MQIFLQLRDCHWGSSLFKYGTKMNHSSTNMHALRINKVQKCSFWKSIITIKLHTHIYIKKKTYIPKEMSQTCIETAHTLQVVSSTWYFHEVICHNHCVKLQAFCLMHRTKDKICHNQRHNSIQIVYRGCKPSLSISEKQCFWIFRLTHLRKLSFSGRDHRSV